jgi:uncharacterized BrkB/YihY/UPF0761 family membrane protein
MKSFLAVLAGLAFVVIVSSLIDFAMYYSGVFAKDEMTATHWLIAVAYRVVISTIGCWIAAKLAPRNPMKHALILGGIGTTIAIIGAAVTWNAGAEFGPHWYPLTLVLTAMPCAWLGGTLASRPSTASA